MRLLISPPRLDCLAMKQSGFNILALFLFYCTTSNLFFFHTVETLLFSAQIRKVMKPHSFRRSRILVWCPVCGGRPGTALDPVVG